MMDAASLPHANSPGMGAPPASRTLPSPSVARPALEAASAAAEGATINDDLTYFLGWADGDAAYPIAAQTWIIAYTTQADPAKAEAIRGFLTYLLNEGQALAPTIDFAPLPESLRLKAIENIAKIGA